MPKLFVKLLFCIFLFVSCATRVHTPYVPPPPTHKTYDNIKISGISIHEKIPLKIAILIPQEERQKTYKHYSNLIWHIGRALEKASVKIFDEYFEWPVEAIEDASITTEDVDAILKLSIEGYNYFTSSDNKGLSIPGELIKLSTLGLITSKHGYSDTTSVEAKIKLVLLNKNGRRIWSEMLNKRIQRTYINEWEQTFLDIRVRKRERTVGDEIYNPIEIAPIVQGLHELAKKFNSSNRVKRYVLELEKRKSKDLFSKSLEPTNGPYASPLKEENFPFQPYKLNFGNYFALVIGIQNYIHFRPLLTPENDALVISEILEKHYGFKVKRLLNPTRSDVLIALSQFRKNLTVKDNLLIYYAGHGWLDKEADEGYWLPVNADRENEVNWISNATITSAVRAMKAKHILVVADSCYSGKLIRGLAIKRKSKNYFAIISRKKARVVLTSGGVEPVADDGGKSQHSVFASAFIDVLKGNNGVLDGTSLFSNLRRPVMVNSDQSPEYADIRKAGHDGGDFLFNRIK